ncbi:MAG TPA: dimethylaniline monooxygenase [Acidimicrobiaceae bacterium]|nr:dimethylaniline monooxygenase [Acidimicrobiaceae bacterium]
MEAVSLLVIGAGPYGVSVAAQARARGIDTVVVGRPMGFWTDRMPRGMFLRSGTDWHLDASEVHTFEAFVEERGISAPDIDPVPIAVFLDYAAWFQAEKHVEVQDRLVSSLEEGNRQFVASLEDGTQIQAETVVAAPGVCSFRRLPDWAGKIPDDLRAHTCDLVDFEALRGGRVLIVGGRQSAYEWAALIGEHGAERIDIVHRHSMPRFERVSWKFVDQYLEHTVSTRGWWRSLAAAEREKIDRRFWEVGRLTLEWWLTPRLQDDRFHRWPGATVVEANATGDDTVTVSLSSGDRLTVDHVVFATGYKADLPSVPYLHNLVGRIDMTDGFPLLDEAFRSSLDGLYLTGFVATRDFGPFFGFTKACPVAASLIVDDLLRRVGSVPERTS